MRRLALRALASAKVGLGRPGSLQKSEEFGMAVTRSRLLHTSRTTPSVPPQAPDRATIAAARIQALVAENARLRADAARLEGFIATIRRALSGGGGRASGTAISATPATAPRKPSAAPEQPVRRRRRATSDPAVLEKRRAALIKARSALAAKRKAA